MKSPSGKGKMVECPDFFGHVASYDAEMVRFRPAAYGILLRESTILLCRSRFTGLWDFPGGGVEPFESLAEGMEREFFEETGIRVHAGDFLYMSEGYIAMFGRPYHSLRFYYRCSLVGTRTSALSPDLGEVTELSWWPLAELTNLPMHDSDRSALAKALLD